MKKVLFVILTIGLLSMGFAKPDLAEASTIISTHFGYPKIETVLLTNDSTVILNKFREAGLLVLVTDTAGNKILDTNRKYKVYDLSDESIPAQKIYITNSVRLKEVVAINFNKAETKATVSYSIEQTAITPFGKKMGLDTLVQNQTVEIELKDNKWQILRPKVKTFSELDWQILRGEKLFSFNCAACHLADGGGSIGPNLTDNYYVFGGTEEDIFRVIKEGGRRGKGMISWKQVMSEAEMIALTKFIKFKLEGTTPKSPKRQEGALGKKKADK